MGRVIARDLCDPTARRNQKIVICCRFSNTKIPTHQQFLMTFFSVLQKRPAPEPAPESGFAPAGKGVSRGTTKGKGVAPKRKRARHAEPVLPVPTTSELPPLPQLPGVEEDSDDDVLQLWEDNPQPQMEGEDLREYIQSLATKADSRAKFPYLDQEVTRQALNELLMSTSKDPDVPKNFFHCYEGVSIMFVIGPRHREQAVKLHAISAIPQLAET